ncbi:arylsulfatase [Croceicoccus estronivorus]|uniref:arylsulfatase n=1 Tax=Croceicoccus estronivorus TaxID=1172626 RepID=UPI0008295F54|nr:arylsulfatase [Croceicoccus estronivorus]OCC25582.1 arylsulfatase [Croceicoccus estronivorus]
MRGKSIGRLAFLGMAAASANILCGGGSAVFAQTAERVTLPYPVEQFRGTIAKSAKDSTPAYPGQVTAPAGAPNVLVIMTDDIGFGAAGTFGGPVPTPNLDRLAARGLIYNRFHTTALCSPTRAALLTGRNHHAVGMGVVTDMATGYPGYNSIIPKSAATVAEVLRQNGYSTAMFGKHHNVPIWETSPAGRFDHWPTGLGFDYFYGFIGGETNQWDPALVRGTNRVAPPDAGGTDSVLDRFLADDAIHWIHEQKASAPDKPFFIYYAPGTAHAPHQAPREWIARFKGAFDDGWDRLRDRIVARQKQEGIIPADTAVTARPEGLPAWDTLSPEEKAVAARMMEVFAGMVAYQDAQVGRVLDEIDRMGETDDTLVIFIEGDNGTSPEGGLHGTTNWAAAISGAIREDPDWLLSQLDELGSENTYGHFPTGWAWALNAPFPWFKQVASHLGGTRNPMVVSWPGQIAQRGLRSQFLDVTDVMPTVLEAAKVPIPQEVNGIEQQRMDGISFVYTFGKADAPDRRHIQYFELFGNRGLYHDGWWAGTTPNRVPWESAAKDPIAITQWPWELYDLRHDFAQAHNLADRYPEKLRSMQELWDKQARENHVYPLDDSTLARLRINPYKQGRTSYTYWGTNLHIAEESAPRLGPGAFSVDADVVIPADGAEGVLLASGGRFGGWAFYFDKGRPTVVYAQSQRPEDRCRVSAPAPVRPGPNRIGYRFDPDAGPASRRGGTMTITVGGQEVARGRVEGISPFMAEATETFDIGDDSGTHVVADYPENPHFNGSLNRIDVTLPEAEGHR